MYKLTEEGRKYLQNGLPEKRLAELVEKNNLPIKDAKEGVENFNIGFMWAKKNGWIRTDKDLIILAKKPGVIPEEDALKRISEGKEIDENMLSVLLRRRLVRLDHEDIVKKAEKFVGKEVTNLAPELIKTGLWPKVKFKPYNVEVTGKTIYPGKRQPYNQFISSVRQKLVELGFKEMSGPIIETEFWNFDALYQAQNHPSRDWTQTYSLKQPNFGKLPDEKIVKNVKAAHETGWKTGSTGWRYKWNPKKASQLVPRAHGTACSARQLSAGVEIPGKYFAIKRCFRPDVIDATHGIEFNQCEGIIVDESITFRNMLGILKEIVFEVSGAEKMKFYPDYYPFTEPSVQVSVKHPEMGWIELAGAGIFRSELTEPLGVKETVMAWGFGIDRLAMYKLNIHDIRDLFSRNLDWLRNQKVITK